MKRSTVSLIAGAAAVPLMAGTAAAAMPDSPAIPATFASAAVAPAAPSMQAAGDTDFSAAAQWAKRDAIREAKRSARSNGLRTYGTSYSAKQAVSRLVSWARSGMGGYHNQCLRLADDAYGATGARTSTALAQWSRAKAAGVAHPGGTDIPVGAQMFWETSHSAGHIATYVGDGKAVTNMPGGAVEIVNWRMMNEWGPYLGWANPYYG